MIEMKINKRVVHARPGQSILQVARKQGIDIPTICHLPGQEARSVCRICSVEVRGSRQLLPACSTPVAHNMEVETHSQRAVQSRKVLMEFMLAEHGAPQTLSPQLLAYAQGLGVYAPRFQLRQEQALDCERYSSDYIKIDLHKCILCDRCISACRDQHVISRAGRGAATRLSFGDHDRPLAETACTSCSDCVAACPTGALSEYGS